MIHVEDNDNAGLDAGATELYNLDPAAPADEYDPYELESRHDDPAYAAVKAHLAHRLRDLRQCSGESCR